jgi:hypothetical protein
MMAYFMRFYKRISLFIGLLSLLSIAFAAASSLQIKSAELDVLGNAYSLDAQFDLNLSRVLQSAVNKGVVLSFLIEFQIVKPRKYWFNSEIVTVRRQVTLNYHALSRQYLVSYDTHQKSFETLAEALQELQHVDDWNVVTKDELEAGQRYEAALLVRLDKNKLPKAIQVDAISSEDWNLASEIYRWSFKETK